MHFDQNCLPIILQAKGPELHSQNSDDYICTNSIPQTRILCLYRWLNFRIARQHPSLHIKCIWTLSEWSIVIFNEFYYKGQLMLTHIRIYFRIDTNCYILITRSPFYLTILRSHVLHHVDLSFRSSPLLWIHLSVTSLTLA